MSITLKNDKEKKIKLEESLQEKTRLLEEQSSYLIALQEELTVLEEDLANLAKKSNLAKESNNTKKNEIFKYDEKIKENNFFLTKARENIKSLLDESNSFDEELLLKLETLYSDEKRVNIIRADLREYLKDINKKKDKREQAFLSATTSFNSAKKELETITSDISKNSKYIKQRSYQIDQKRDEITKTTEKLRESKERNHEFEETINKQKATLNNINKELESLQEESITLITKEEKNHSEIEKLNQEVSRLEEYRKKVSLENTTKIKKLKTLNIEIEKLQNKSTYNQEAISEFRSNSKELNKDISQLETTIADYEAKISIQKNYFKQNGLSIKNLTNQNHILLQKVKKLESILADYEAKNLISSQKVTAEENKIKQNKASLNRLSHKAVKMNVDTSEMGDILGIDKSLEVNFPQKIRAMQRDLEKQFFNLSIAPLLGDISKINHYEQDKLNIFQDIQTIILSEVEKEFNKDAEIFVCFDINKSIIQSEISISHLTKVSNNDAKENIIPLTSQLVKDYKDQGLVIDYRVKFKADGNLDKLKVIVSLPFIAPIKEAGLQK